MICHVAQDPEHRGRYLIARAMPFPRRPQVVLDDLDHEEAIARIFARYYGTDPAELVQALEQLVLKRIKSREVHAPEGVPDHVLEYAVRTLERLKKTHDE